MSKTMCTATGNARYIGRVGVLAVALGIGVGLAATPWAASAKPFGSGSSSSSDSESTSVVGAVSSGGSSDDLGCERLWRLASPVPNDQSR
jgi:hypothetical protein